MNKKGSFSFTAKLNFLWEVTLVNQGKKVWILHNLYYYLFYNISTDYKLFDFSSPESKTALSWYLPYM
jgi:hypothetical protein